MRIDIMTLFPDSMGRILGESIIGRASAKGIIEINCVQIRDYTDNKQCQVDDYPYGGGWGCVMMAQPLKACLDDIMSKTGGKRSRVIYMSPQGKTFTQQDAKRLRDDYDHLVLVCGHYEGIDERFIEECVDEEISIGDFVMTGGEIPAMAVADSVCRLVPGVLSDEECFTGESHWDGLLEYPQYTRPEVWENRAVPKVLLSGNHEDVSVWRRKQSIMRTMDKRPDMFEKLTLTAPVDKRLLSEIIDERTEKPVQYSFESRHATEDDVNSVMEIINTSGRWFEGNPEEEDVLRNLRTGGTWMFSHKGRDVGFISFSCKHSHSGIIRRAAIVEDYHGTGLSDEMFSLAEDLVLGHGIPAVRAYIYGGDMPARKILERRGYAICDMADPDPDGHITYEKVF